MSLPVSTIIFQEFFALMDPVPGAIEAVYALKDKYDLYILSSSPWENPTALGDKLAWVKKYFGGEGSDNVFFRKVIFFVSKEFESRRYFD